MKRLLIATTLLAGLPLAANATLQLSGNVNGTLFSAFDNNVSVGTLLDIDPTLGTLQLASTTIGGVVVVGSLSTALLSGPFELNTTSLNIVNTNSTPVTIDAIASATGFAGPAAQFSASGSATFQNAINATIRDRWWDDPANAQGAPGTPGTLVADSGIFINTGSPNSFSFNSSGPVNDPSAFSMTFEFTATLPGGTGACLTGTLTACPRIVGDQLAEEKTPGVPEPTSLAILGAGLLGLGLVRRRFRS